MPALLGIGGYWLNKSLKEREIHATLEGQRSQTLHNYLDNLSGLLKEQQNRLSRASSDDVGEKARLPNRNNASQAPDPFRLLLRMRTISALDMLDGRRKRILVNALIEAGLVQKSIEPNRWLGEGSELESVIELADFDLSEADLRGLNLSGIDMRGVNLRVIPIRDRSPVVAQRCLNRATIARAGWVHLCGVAHSDP